MCFDDLTCGRALHVLTRYVRYLQCIQGPVSLFNSGNVLLSYELPAFLACMSSKPRQHSATIIMTEHYMRAS